jgi:hypothetical protein
MSKIAVPQACYDRICQELQNKQGNKGNDQIKYQFDGDTFQTSIWREGAALMARDPRGVREIIVMGADQLLNGNPGNLKGLFTQLLLQKGFDQEIIISLLSQIKSELERLDIASRGSDVNAAQDARRHAGQLFKTLVVLCEKQQEGGAVVSVSHANFSAILPAKSAN